jgi:hypothetical protein
MYLHRLGTIALLLGCILAQMGHCLEASSHNCAIHVAYYEQKHGIPAGLLHAISKVESGRKDDAGRFAAWPWTVNARGQGYYFPTKDAAIAAVRQMQFDGVKSIDVGCMQINLHHHPYAFQNLNEAFEPAKNVAYAALFLTRLKEEHASWRTAVSFYHSANPVHHIPYQRTVLSAWKRQDQAGGSQLAVEMLEGSIPRINRLRRLATRKASLTRSFDASSASRPAVRRVTRYSHLTRTLTYNR